MMNNPMAQIMSAIQRGINPNQIAMQLIQSDPAVRQAAQFMNGKTPQQIRDGFFREAQARGVDPNQIARQLGVQLPK